jgi:hypothetical protein
MILFPENFPEKGISRARICKPFMEPRNRFPAWRAGTATLPARLHRLVESIPPSIPGPLLNVYKFRLRKDDISKYNNFETAVKPTTTLDEKMR